MNESTFIRKLTSSEIIDLKEELEINDHLWTLHHHDLSRTSLKDGKSIHLQWTNNELEKKSDNWSTFSKTLSIIKLFSKENDIGRVYWHRLLPGDTIEPHTDANLPFVRNGRLLKRYQIYLDVDKDQKVILDNKKIDSELLNNSIVDFQLRNLHSYNNMSTTTLYLLVFDVVVT